MTNFVPCNLSKFWFTPYHIIDFVQSKFMKVQNQKSSDYKDEIPKKKIIGRKIGNDIYYRG